MLEDSRRSFVVVLTVATCSTLLYSRSLFTRYGGQYYQMVHHQRQMDMMTDNQSRASTSSMTRKMDMMTDNQSRVPTPSMAWPTCKEKRRIAFAKNHKVGGDTIKRILDRFGYVRKLNFVVPRSLVVSKLYPHRLYPAFYMPPPPKQRFDILDYHTVYERTQYREIFPDDTAYVAMIREPLSHLKSVWNYYKLNQRYKIVKDGTDPILTFLKNPGRYDRRCGHGRHVPYCLTQNSMSADLGFHNKHLPTGSDVGAREAITQRFLQIIQEDFHLVMIMEYFDESLVLLKRLMCWTLQDILYYKTNVRHYTSKETHIPPELRQIHREWSYVDYALYDHFNQTFWKKINSAGNDFWDEVRYFKHINEQMRELCGGFRPSRPCSVPNLHVEDSRWGPGFTIDTNFCLLAKTDLRCHLLLQSERTAKALRLDRNNITLYGEIDRRYEEKKLLRRNKRGSKVGAVDVVLKNCAYCKLSSCSSFAYLTHFHQDGYVSNAAYRDIIDREFPTFNKQCERSRPSVFKIYNHQN